jgi:hypothetical protein
MAQKEKEVNQILDTIIEPLGVCLEIERSTKCTGREKKI